MIPADLTLADLPLWAQAAVALLALAAPLALLAWRRAVQAGRADRAAAEGQRLLDQERLRERDARLGEAAAGAQALRADLAALQGQAGQEAALSARRAEAVARLEAQLDRLAQAQDAALREHESLRRAHSELQAEHRATLADRDEKLASARRETEALKALREELTRRFEEVANATLRQTGADFEKAHRERLTTLLAPFREHVGRFEEELRQVHGAADKERARLGEQIRLLSQKTEAIGAEALNLTRALKGDKRLQGAWGEMILERILEDSGLEAGTHYQRQQSHTGEDGARYRPDVIVRLPQGKCLVVDSKVSLVAYEAACTTEDEAARTRHLKEHAAALRRHVELLSGKGYETLAAGSVDYVLMFVPIEGAFSEAARIDAELPAFASARRVGLVTPTTLMLALKTVDHIWTVEKRERNAEEIAARAGLLYDKFAGFVDDLERVGKALDQAVRARDEAMGKLATGSGNLLRQAEMLRELGARTRKQLALASDEAEAATGPPRATLAAPEGAQAGPPDGPAPAAPPGEPGEAASGPVPAEAAE